MRTTLIASTLILSVGLGLSLAQSADEAAIKKLSDDYAAAVKKSDAKALAALHADDAVRASGAGIWVGRDKVEKGLTEQFANGPAGGGGVSITMHDMKMIADDVAIVHGAYKAANGTGHFIRTLVKKDGSWKVAAIQIAADPS